MRLAIHSLYSYPVKSCAGIAHERVRVTGSGLDFDRHWVIVDARGVFMTQRQHPRMVLIRPEPVADGLWLRAPGQADCFVPPPRAQAEAVTVAIWGTPTLGADQGDEAAAWLSAFIGAPCRLLRLHPRAHRLASLPHVTRWIQTHPDWPHSFLPVDRHAFAFADGFPFLVANLHSLEELNGQLADQGIAASGASGASATSRTSATSGDASAPASRTSATSRDASAPGSSAFEASSVGGGSDEQPSTTAAASKPHKRMGR